MSDFTRKDEEWMRAALIEADKAMYFAEIPVASILVAGDKELAKSQTLVKRKGSIAAHGELFAILEAGEKIWAAERPLTIYTTLEPCLMCIGASMQAGIDRIVFGMKAAPDGASSLTDAIRDSDQTPPSIEGGLLEKEAVKLMERFKKDYSDSPAIPYVTAMLDAY